MISPLELVEVITTTNGVVVGALLESDDEGDEGDEEAVTDVVKDVVAVMVAVVVAAGRSSLIPLSSAENCSVLYEY